MSFSTKENYEQLTEKMGGKLPPGYQKKTFTSYAYGRTVVGFKPYREKYAPNGNHDVRTEGKNSYVKITLPDGRPCWASLSDGSDYVRLLGWGDSTAFLSDFSESDQQKLIDHRDQYAAEV